MGSIRGGLTAPRRLVAVGAVVATLAAGMALMPSAAHAAVPDGAQKTLVVLEQTASHPMTDVTPAIAMSRVFTGSDSANAYFKEVSGGRISLVGDKNAAGDVIGPITLTGVDSCNTGQYINQAKAAAQAQGYDPNVYRHIVIYAAKGADCGSGLASVGGNWSIVAHYASTQILTHELGHNLGLEHAGSMTCKTSSGTVVSMAPGANNSITDNGPAGCSTYEYGDPYSTMGNWSPRWYDAPQMAELGWITPSQVNTVTKTGTYTLNTMENFSAATRTLKIPVGSLHNVSLWIEHRQSTGQYDQFGTNGVTNGVSIRLATDTSLTHLINMHPGGSFANSQLDVGQTFVYNPSLSIRLVSLDATTGVAQVRVEFYPHFVTKTIANGTVGTAYSQTITAAGGAQPYGWRVSSGSLPPGLKLGGATANSITLSGTPTTAGAYTFQLRVRDAAGLKRWHTFHVTIS